MINELLGIEYNIEKARLDGKVQNLAYYINEKTLITSHKEMDRKKAKGIDGITKDDYSVNLKANVEPWFTQDIFANNLGGIMSFSNGLLLVAVMYIPIIAILFLAIYALVLSIKALKIYIDKNSYRN